MKAVFFIFALCLSMNASATAHEVVSCVRYLNGKFSERFIAQACKGTESAVETVSCVFQLKEKFGESQTAEACSHMKK